MSVSNYGRLTSFPDALSVKSTGDWHAFQLPFRILIKGADAHIPNSLPVHTNPTKVSGNTL
jgi:hypothetical protein